MPNVRLGGIAISMPAGGAGCLEGDENTANILALGSGFILRPASDNNGAYEPIPIATSQRVAESQAIFAESQGSGTTFEEQRRRWKAFFKGSIPVSSFEGRLNAQNSSIDEIPLPIQMIGVPVAGVYEIQLTPSTQCWRGLVNSGIKLHFLMTRDRRPETEL